ncbi:MAG: hypothetical protein AB7N76_05075 [Planctomycetota bacterium]
MSGSALGDEVRGYLLQRYPGATATAALWEWAGGDAAAAPREGDAAALWAEGWARAAARPAAPAALQAPRDPNQLALVREALYDEPGHPLLLDHLHEVALAEHGEAVLDAVLVLESLERAVRCGGAAELVSDVLRAFRQPTWEAAFACLAPACEEWLSAREREDLAAACRAVAARGRVAAEVFALRDALRAIEAEDEAQPGVDAVIERLKEVLRHAERALPQGDELRRGLERLVHRLAFRKQLTLKATIANLTSLLVGADLHQGDELGPAAFGLLAALWGTNPLPPPREEEPPEDLSLPTEDDEDDEG